MYEGDRIVTVSTIKETPAGVDRFVKRSLRSGIDHMLIFLDAKQPRVRSMLEDHPCVTVVRTDPDYWRGDRPDVVMDRQMINANLACTALAGVPSVRWLFHIDGDEALAFDRDDLLAIDARAVRFKTLEAVARRRWLSGEPQLFKRQPSGAELHALAALGIIKTPEMHSFYRGHHLGKSGVKPDEQVRFRIHTVFELPDRDIDAVIPPDMHLLHYESWCLDDFIARWREFDPEKARRRPFKDKRLGAAFHVYYNDPSHSEKERRRLIAGLFDEFVADDPAPLRRFDLLIRSPLRTAQPRPLAAAEVARLEEALADLHHADKSGFRSSLIQGPKFEARTS